MNWGDVREWNPEGLDAVVDDITAELEELQELADRLKYHHPVNWSGEASKAAMRQRRELLADLQDFEQPVEPVWKELHHTAEQIRTLHREQDRVEEHARGYYFSIAYAGDLVDELPAGPYDEDFRRQRDDARTGIAAEITAALKQAETIDANIAAAMRRARDPQMYADARGNKSRLNRPPKDASPDEVANWWKGLSEAERQELIDTHPQWVGSTDGVPVDYRDTANRITLEGVRDRLEDERAALQSRLAKGEYIDTAGRVYLEGMIEKINGKLDGIAHIEDRLENSADTPEHRRHYLLGTRGADAGQAIVAVGNPDEASNVATYVPGTGAGLDGIKGDMERGDRMQEAAERAGAESSAVVTWVGYDAPQSVATEATQEKYAEAAKDDLARFQDGLRATHAQPQPSQNTLVGHSYGAVVVGHTLRDFNGADVNKAIMVAGPGTGVDHARDLNIGAENVYAVTDSKDPINLTPRWIHGPQPDADDFGARTFESDSGAWTVFEGAHSKYWDDTNPSLQSMGNVIAGEEP